MQKHRAGENKATPNQKTSQNTTSCAALQNLIKSTSKSVNFGVWIQNVYQCYLCRWLLRDVQHFQNPCVSFICMFGTRSSVATVLSSAGLPPCVIVHLCITKSHRTQISGWVCFVLLFPETDPHILSVFQASWKDKKTCVEADALGFSSGP